ncbi:UNVERIFIED_CONTAM: hypothetical protein NCL1_49841 [Trichonephila clavipes]
MLVATICFVDNDSTVSNMRKRLFYFKMVRQAQPVYGVAGGIIFYSIFEIFLRVQAVRIFLALEKKNWTKFMRICILNLYGVVVYGLIL